MKKNILIFSNSLVSGGAEKQSLSLASALRSYFDVIYLVFNGDQCEDKFRYILDRERIHYILLKGNILSKLKSIYSIFKKNNIYIAFTYLATTNFWAAVIGRLAGVKHVVGGIRINTQSGRRFLINKALHNSSLFRLTVFNNHVGKKSLIDKGFNPQKCLVIHNCIDVVNQQITRKRKTVVSIVTVARFAYEKDYLTAICSIKALQERDPNKKVRFKYQIVGYGSLEAKIRNFIEEQNLDNIIDLFINPENVDKCYRNADIYLSTSIREGISNSIMEAMSYSLPIVATDAGDNQYLVRDGVNGFVCNIGDYKKISERLSLLVSSVAMRNEMGKESYRIIKNDFSVQRFSRKYLELIAELDKDC